jgi:16S rRNA (uracil1498-N3)-methyltransferase
VSERSEQTGEPRGPRSSEVGPRFVLATDPAREAPRLVDEDAQHALRVLRLGPGDRLVGLDGRGTAWPLVVSGVTKRALALAVAGEPTRTPAPGSPEQAAGQDAHGCLGSAPAVEVALSLPRGGRAEDSVGRLAQLGAARITPLVTQRSPPHARAAGDARRERLARAGREAAKQCGRSWFPEVLEPVGLAEWSAARGSAGGQGQGIPLAWLDPYAAASLLAWPAPRTARVFALAIGPEGGFTPEEEALLAAQGATRVRIGGHVLRLETAAEAALAVVMTMALDAALERARARGGVNAAEGPPYYGA